MNESLNEQLFWIMNRPLGTAVDYFFIFFTITGYAFVAVHMGLVSIKLFVVPVW